MLASQHVLCHHTRATIHKCETMASKAPFVRPVTRHACGAHASHNAQLQSLFLSASITIYLRVDAAQHPHLIVAVSDVYHSFGAVSL